MRQGSGRILRILAVIGCLAAAPTPARPELVRFRAGGQADLPARVEGTTVVLDAPGGPARFDLREIRSIAPSESPGRLWEARREAALRDGPAASFAAARWALEHGLTDEAIATFHSAHESDPGFPPAARMEVVLARLRAPMPDPDPGAIDTLGRGRFHTASSDHVLLLHQHPDDEARERLELLERVVTSFYASFAARGFSLRVPARKLVTVWFAEQSDYRAFLRADGASAFLNTRGYYHPTRRVVFAYDERSGEPFRSRARSLERAPDARASLLLDLARREADVATAAHELVHLLVAESGLAPRHEDFPIWLHEGLAMQFEASRGGRWAGIGRVNPLRLAPWGSIPEKPPLVPLLRDVGFGRGYRADRYAAAWALVYFLSGDRPESFHAFLDLLRAPSGPSDVGPDRVVAAFRSAFGDDLAGLQAEWHRRMRPAGPPTPAE